MMDRKTGCDNGGCDRQHCMPSAAVSGLPTRVLGLSMIELMVAVTISLVLMFGVGQIYLGSKASYRVRDDLTMMQETGRFAMERLTAALMMADHYGGVDVANISGSPSGVTGRTGDCDAAWVTDVLRGIQGSDGAANISGVTGFANCINNSYYIANSDVLVMRYAGSESLDQTVVDAASSSKGLFIRTSLGIRGVLFKGGTGSVTATDLFPTETRQDGTNNYEYRVEAYVLRPCSVLDGSSCTDGIPTLTRLELTGGTSGPEIAQQPLVDGVEQIQYQYGVDVNDDGLAEQFLSATSVIDWDEVIAVRIDMLVRTPNEDDQYLGDNTNYTLAGGTVDNGLVYTVPTAAKKFRRKQFTKVVQIRNRIRY